jgi:phosphonate metabolism protein PhnN/1,5-bisphosphokinase (PRPP-forming)
MVMTGAVSGADTGAGIPGLPTPGRLFYVVGPSGVGKDALLHWAREQLADQHAQSATRLPALFARRTITRVADTSEDHEPVDALTFEQQRKAGRFALHWHANGTSYGIDCAIDAALAAGRDVVVNGSREHVPHVWDRYPHAMIVWITAASQTIAQRLAARGRETGDALAERTERGNRFSAPADARIVTIDNSGALQEGGAQLLALLQAD